MNRLDTPMAQLRPEITGLHHIRLPVTDVLRSRDWYGEVLGFEPVLDLEEEDRLLGTSCSIPSG
jgi:catechol 2,3-dioxygenase-like lactoylglutathione lyase family enzyme